MFRKLKSFIQNDQTFFSLIVLVVGVTSFGLGRASVSEKGFNMDQNERSEASLGTPTTNGKGLFSASEGTNTPNTNNQPNLSLIASKSGTKYHLESCPGAKQIKETNIIRFNSITEAEAAGYKPAVNCPGLQ